MLQDEGTVKNDQGTLQYDQVQLSYCHIAAPIKGRVGLRLVDPGNLVTANGTTVLVVITQMDPITVIFTLPEDNLDQVEAEMRKQKSLPVDALDRAQLKKIASGKLSTIDNQIDTTTGTVKLRAHVQQPGWWLFPEPVCEYQTSGEDGRECDPCADQRHSAQRPDLVCLRDRRRRPKCATSSPASPTRE